jgi:hypothetical protein
MTKFRFELGQEVKVAGYDTPFKVISTATLITAEPAYILEPHPPEFDRHVPESAITPINPDQQNVDQGAGDPAPEQPAPQGEQQSETPAGEGQGDGAGQGE